MATRRERRILAATAALAVGVPAGAAAWVRSSADALAARLTEEAGAEARIGAVDADLTGAVRLGDVALGDLIACDALEASVAMGPLLDGRLRADELRIEGPRLALRIDPAGGSALLRLARGLARRAVAKPDRSGHGSSAPALPRIVVVRGALTAQIAGVGELAAEGVEIVPDAGGIRVVAGPVRLRGRLPQVPVSVELSFPRAAVELALPALRAGRIAAVEGTGTVAGPGAEPAALRGVALARSGASGALELRAAVVDGAGERPLAIDVQPDLAIAIRGDRIPLRALAGLAPAGLDLAGARASGAVTIRRRPGAAVVSADAAIDHLVVDHPAVAAHPAPLSGRVRGEAAISRDAIAWTSGGVELGAARLATSGWIRRAAPLSGQLEVQLAPTPCADLLASLPPELRGPLDGMVLGGTIGARARLVLDLSAPPGEGAALESAPLGGCTALAEPPAADVTRLAAAAEQQLPDGSHRRIGPGEPDHVALRSLPAYVPAAFVSVEDARFFEHAGFDLGQIARSLELDLRERRLVRGGSTISQQLVKNAFLSQRRSFDRKLHEAVLAWRLEARLDKRQILERYLDAIELGPHVFGLGPAARYWFGVPAHELTLRQAAFLAALTSQPASMSRRVRAAGGLDPESAERVDGVLRAMRAAGAIPADARAAARTAPLRFAESALRE